MGVNYFTDEQVKELRKNPYVKNVSNKAITYEEEFKELFLEDYQNGLTPSVIFQKYGFNTKDLGQDRINSFTKLSKNKIIDQKDFLILEKVTVVDQSPKTYQMKKL